MTVRLKPVEEQVIVLTGASSGIGPYDCAHVRRARGQGLVLVARNEEALSQVATELSAKGTRAIAVPADVAKREDLERVARTAIETFGGFDTWVNDAAVALYGTLEEILIEDQRRQFEVNYWGVVNGSPRRPTSARARRRSDHQYRQRAVRARDDLPDAVLGLEARRESVHRRFADGARARGRSDLGDLDQAIGDRYPLPRTCSQLSRGRAQDSSAGL